MFFEISADDGYSKTKWRQERIWIEAVEKEGKSIQEWAEKWAFLTDYDQKVIHREAKNKIFKNNFLVILLISISN